MTTTTDRRAGLSASVAYKAPVTVLATSNITLSGEQTIDGVALLEVNAAGRPDRVLCVGQTDSTRNGIWDVSTGSWTRSKDANGNRDLAKGTQVLISQGSAANQIWTCTATDPITVDTSALTWSQSLSAGFLATLAATGGAALIGTALGDDVQGILDALFARTAAEVAAGVTPTRYGYLPLDIRRYGALVDGSTDDTAAWSAALLVASQTVSGVQGSTVTMPTGATIVSSTLNIPNRVAIRGVNKRGSIIRAKSTHSGTYMFTVDNGTSSMFDNPLEDLTIDCNDVAGMGGILSDAWQEGGGLRRVLIYKFRTYGIRFQNGDGGAALCEIDQCEIFPSTVSAATAGIRVDQISANGNFVLSISNTTIAGNSTFSLPKGVDVANDSLRTDNVHFEYCTSGVYLNGAGKTALTATTGGPSVTNVVEIDASFGVSGSLRMQACHRASATNIIKDNRTGGMGAVSSVDTDFWLSTRPIFGPGFVNSCGVFDGTSGASPAVTNCFGVNSITRTTTGTYLVAETWARPSTYCIPGAWTKLSGGRVTVTLVSNQSYQIETFNSTGGLANDDEVKFQCTRVV